MRVISRRALREFWEKHRAAEEPMAVWFRLMDSCNFNDLSAVKRVFGTADYVAPYTVFNVGGNKYRVITSIHYNRRRVFIRDVFTHPEYDRWTEQIRKRKRKS